MLLWLCHGSDIAVTWLCHGSDIVVHSLHQPGTATALHPCSDMASSWHCHVANETRPCLLGRNVWWGMGDTCGPPTTAAAKRLGSVSTRERSGTSQWMSDPTLQDAWSARLASLAATASDIVDQIDEFGEIGDSSSAALPGEATPPPDEAAAPPA